MMDNARHKRDMRVRRDSVIKRSPIVMLDIGSSKIAAMIVQFMAPESIEQAGHSFRILASLEMVSQGVRYGEVASMVQFQKDVMRILQNVQRAAGIKIDYAAVCFSGGRPESYGATGEVAVESGEVSENDIARAMLACEFPILPDGREFIHALPINFTLDHKTGLDDPRGQIGARLAVDMHMLAVDSSTVHNLEQAIKSTDIELISLTTSPFMTGLAVLTEDEMKRGAAVIDFGAMTTSVSVFFAGQLMFVKNIRIGGYHVTSDISQALGISFQMAERLKNLHGGVEATAQDDRETIDLSDGSEAEFQERRTVTRTELIGIIRPRLEEIFEEIQSLIDQAGLDEMPNQRFVVAGGASQIAGLEGLAERFLRQRVRIGRTIKLAGASAQQTTAGFGAVSGLAVHTAKPKDEMWDFVNPNTGRSQLSMRAIFGWFKENW